jgi:large subunit ribosomal protein L29
MLASEFRQMETAELHSRLEELREGLFRLRLQWNTGQLDNPNEMKKVRKDIARLMTVLRERELAAEIVKGETGNA